MNRSKLLIVIVFAAGAAVLLTPGLYAGAYEWGGLGSRAAAMGGAFIGLADDWTASYWNPGGLAQLGGNGVGIDLLSPHVTIRGSNSFANLPPSPGTYERYKYTKDVFINYSGLEPYSFSKTSTNYHFYQPQGAGCYVTLPEFTLGIAVYSPMGYYSDWEDTVPYGMGSIYAKNFQQLIIVETQFTIAREIVDGLYAGAGAALIYDRLERKSDKDVQNSGILDYHYDFDIKDDGFGAEGMFGLLYQISDMISLGGVYRTGSTVKMTGKASSSLTFMGLSEDTHNTYKFRHPPTWGIGVAVKPIVDRLTLTADFQQSLWSFYRTNVQYNQDGVLLQSSSYDEDWHDSNRYRIGGEYMLKPTWALRAGYFFDESPLPAKAVSLAHIADVDRNNFTFGTGFEVARDFSLDLLGAYGWGDRTAEGAKFEQRIWAVGLDATYLF
ncbi:MAG: outer membrane protein transport protein [PVC group bacterium]